jgi:signal transduction histidine kinase
VRSPTGVVWAQAPVQLGASRIGEVLVGYDASAMHRTLRDIGLMWTAGLLIVSGALYLGLRRTLQRRLIQPVEQLAARLCDFAETGEIERDGLPCELARVVRTFEDLCRRLAESGRQRVEAERLARGATERLCREQRLASVGQLAAGLAHSLNTPLGNIVGYAQQARRATQEPALAGRLDVIEEQAKVCAALVRHLLDSVRPPEAHPRALDLMPRIEATVALMEPVLRDRGIARIRIAGAIANPVWADPSCVEQVLFNLLTNASEAGARRIDIALDEHAGQARLTLTDDGQGIPESIRARLFEPFVSGKPPGKGTGLGLHLCQTLLRSVGGDIDLLDTGPAGTRFRIAWRSLTPEHQQ